jgi:hypothetical protein
LRRVHFLEQAEVGIVNDLPFLAFLDGFDGEADLLAELVNLVAVRGCYESFCNLL